MLVSDYSLDRLVCNINTELPLISKWFVDNKLSLNIDKSCFILFHHPHKQIDIDSIKVHIGGSVLKNVSSTKFLDLYIDQNITWKDHIKYIGNRIAKNTGIIRKISWYVPSHVLLLLYYSLI